MDGTFNAYDEQGTQRPSQRPSQSVSAQYTADCPTCGAKGASEQVNPETGRRVDGEPCRSRTTGRVTDTHRARIEAQYPSHAPS